MSSGLCIVSMTILALLRGPALYTGKGRVKLTVDGEAGEPE